MQYINYQPLQNHNPRQFRCRHPIASTLLTNNKSLIFCHLCTPGTPPIPYRIHRPAQGVRHVKRAWHGFFVTDQLRRLLCLPSPRRYFHTTSFTTSRYHHNNNTTYNPDLPSLYTQHNTTNPQKCLANNTQPPTPPTTPTPAAPVSPRPPPLKTPTVPSLTSAVIAMSRLFSREAISSGARSADIVCYTSRGPTGEMIFLFSTLF